MVMSRQRALPPDIFTDERLIALPNEMKLTAIGMRLNADDYGRETATRWLLKSSIWPGNPEVTEAALTDHLLTLAEVGYIQLYGDGSRDLYQILDWPSVSHRLPSKFPPPPLRSAAGAAPEPLSAGEREREEESDERWERPPGVPPSPFCPDHQPAGSGGTPCVKCRDTRIVYERWIADSRRGAEDA